MTELGRFKMFPCTPQNQNGIIPIMMPFNPVDYLHLLRRSILGVTTCSNFHHLLEMGNGLWKNWIGDNHNLSDLIPSLGYKSIKI